MFKETIRSHDDDKGFTLTTVSCSSAFAVADKMAFLGHSVKLLRDSGCDWTVVVREVAPCDSTAPAAR